MVEEQQRLGRYELLAEIGRGAMGVVYKARDPIIDRVLAIKTVDFRGLGEVQSGVQARFFQEAQSAGRLSHPNIVTIFDAGEADGCAYIAMELLEGPSLREVLDQGPPMSVTRALEIAGQIARGLAYAHEHGVVHRDVKPGNVILVSRRVKITDFGIARLPFGAANAQSELAGSPKYMSPEQVLGENIDGRSDLFALGTVLYEMLTGRQPFVGDSVPAIMQAVLLHEPPPPSAANPRVPASVDEFVRRVLSKRPEDRHPSARALLRELSALLKSLNGTPGRSSRSSHRRRASHTVKSDGDTTVLLPAHKRERTHRGSRAKWWYTAAAVMVAGVLTAMTLERKPQAVAHVEAEADAPAIVAIAAPMPVIEHSDESISEHQSDAVRAEVPPPPAAKRAAPPKRQATRHTHTKTAKAAAEPRKAEAVDAPATLLVAVAPWGEVFVDGQSHGMAPPLASIPVSAGKHRVEIRNGNLPAHKVDVNVAAGDTRRIKHKFE